MTGTLILRQDVRIGVQVVVDGEKVDVERFLTLLSAFLEVVIPALGVLQMVGISILAALSVVQDGFNKVAYLWVSVVDLIASMYALIVWWVVTEVFRNEVEIKFRAGNN